ncbi:ParA family protein [Dyadobacter frigoris]|uniref:ParA family protein n=1 Tax=Dyadobacter frigoris TaxID=2576211 RepID=A0A4U6DHR3_9BACT|nr:AAA family ATPase [Dyadobacter frigoris]TKT94264.1 ParA family protein [Dyadobacter frigoris]GLU50546.1 phage-related regulatory protein [Dyadobacter frigoris]
MISIAMFNNKGGVGKTTLTNNIASYIAENYQKRVLVVDCDPQCNTTQLLMGEEFSTKLYWNREQSSTVTTISQILQPIEDGDSDISSIIVPIKSSETRFNVDLIPGSPKFSIIEDRLGAAWHELKGGDIGGIRKSNWNKFLIDKVKNNYDYIFFDLGPSLGSINRSVLIGCDYFITPMGTDIFSILGIRNIAEWLSSWLDLYDNSLKLCEQRAPGVLKRYNIPEEVKVKSGYIGYTIQQYITKSYGGVRRPTKAYEEIINSVPAEIENSLGKYWKSNLEKQDLKLGDVPHLYSLIPLAQSNASPLLKLKGSDGLVGSQFKQVQDYQEILKKIVEKLFNNLNK